jgi:hypothetical protein
MMNDYTILKNIAKKNNSLKILPDKGFNVTGINF